MRAKVGAFPGRFMAFAALWWVLSEGSFYGWGFGLLLANCVTLVSLSLLPPSPWRHRWRYLPGFMLFFARQSFLGGLDVAYRALHPKLPMQPGFLSYPLSLPPGLPRLYLAWVVSLLPGTVSVELGEEALELHMLDGRLPIRESLRALEQQLSRLVVPRA